jgi:hypothetical protein
MQRVALALLAILAFASEQAPAQDKPLRVEIVTATPHQLDPILVRVTNLTTKTIKLALPLYFYGRTNVYRQIVPSDPLDIERRKPLGWEELSSELPTKQPRTSPEIAPGETKEYEFSVSGAGEYRVRVWYVVSPPQPGPPPRPAELRSVVSASIRVK